MKYKFQVKIDRLMAMIVFIENNTQNIENGDFNQSTINQLGEYFNSIGWNIRADDTISDEIKSRFSEVASVIWDQMR